MFPGTPSGSRWGGRLQMKARQEKCSTMAAELGAPGGGCLCWGLPYLALDTGSR
jgi:hypothetical protein